MLTANSSNNDTILYRVQPGDNLGAIIQRYYGPVSLQQKNDIISKIQADNPKVTNPNLIRPDQLLQIDIPPQYCATPGYPQQSPTFNVDPGVLKTFQDQWQHTTPQERDLLSALAPVMLGTGAASIMMINHTFKTNASLVAEIAKSYNEYSARKITKGRYDYQRRKLLGKLKIKLGPTKLLLNGNKPLKEVLRISRTKGSVPTQAMTHQIKRMGSLAKLASRGGVVLSVVGLGVACHEIANTNNAQQKNEILVESLGGLSGGALYGATATAVVIFMATPVGWVAGLAIGVGSVIAGYSGSVIAKNVYNVFGNKVDFASKTGVSQLCKK